ncbi:UNVERIFIED_CONTAM: hypothetical protein Sindi_1812800 [Sesamum indicum]
MNGGSQRSRTNDVCIHCREMWHWKRECPQLLSNQGTFVIQVLERNKRLCTDEMLLRFGDNKAVATETMGSVNLAISDRHISTEMMRKLAELRSVEADNLDKISTCESCPKEKMTKKPFVRQSTLATGLLDLIYTDVYGTLNTPAKGGYSYFITFTHNHSRYGFVYLIRYKSEPFERFKEFRLEIENPISRKSKPFCQNEYALKTATKLLNMASPIAVPQTPYEIWHGKLAFYRYLRVSGSPPNVKRLVGDKLESMSSLYRFVGYLKETAWFYFYHPLEQKNFVSRNVIFLKKDFSMDAQCDEELLEESSEIPHQDNATPSVPTIPSNSALVLRRSTRISQRPIRYGFLSLISQLDGDLTTYREAMYGIDSDKWLEAMKSEIHLMVRIKFGPSWTHLKALIQLVCKWVYKQKLGGSGEVTAFRARLVAKDTLNDPGSTLRKPIRLWQWLSPFDSVCHCSMV